MEISHLKVKEYHAWWENVTALACLKTQFLVLRRIPVCLLILVRFSRIEPLLATRSCCGVCVMCILSFPLLFFPCSFCFVRCVSVHCCLVRLQTVFLPSSESQKLRFGCRLTLLISFVCHIGRYNDPQPPQNRLYFTASDISSWWLTASCPFAVRRLNQIRIYHSLEPAFVAMCRVKTKLERNRKPVLCLWVSPC